MPTKSTGTAGERFIRQQRSIKTVKEFKVQSITVHNYGLYRAS